MTEVVVIVARTKMRNSRRCVGALNRQGQSLRLFDKNSNYPTVSSKYKIGQKWKIEYYPQQNCIAPHVENVRVLNSEYIGDVDNLRNAILQVCSPWRGAIEVLFEEKLCFTRNNNGYVSQSTGLPSMSTGFWLPDHDLTLRSDNRHYDYPMGVCCTPQGLAYVGEVPAVPRIAKDTLVRVSLAQPWDYGFAEMEERCHLQLSGWYE